jgi:hypothetical protein
VLVYLQPTDGQPLPAFKPGQFLTFATDITAGKAVAGPAKRTIPRYSLSDRPDPAHDHDVAPAIAAVHGPACFGPAAVGWMPLPARLLSREVPPFPGSFAALALVALAIDGVLRRFEVLLIVIVLNRRWPRRWIGNSTAFS